MHDAVLRYIDIPLHQFLSFTVKGILWRRLYPDIRIRDRILFCGTIRYFKVLARFRIRHSFLNKASIQEKTASEYIGQDLLRQIE